MFLLLYISLVVWDFLTYRFCPLSSFLRGFAAPTRILVYWNCAGWVFHLFGLICFHDSVLVCKYGELLCCFTLLTFLIVLYSVLLKSFLCCLTATLDDPVMDSCVGFHFISTNSSVLCDCKNLSSISRYLILHNYVVPTKHVSTAPNCTFAFSWSQWDSYCFLYIRVELLHKYV